MRPSKNLWLFILASTIFLSKDVSAQSNGLISRFFSFTLKSQATTSAGVYTKDGTLLRTIWSGEKFAAGEQIKEWDGLDDDGKEVKDKSVDIKVLSNNVQYTWDGARIGNTSTALTGATKHRLFEPTRGMAVLGSTVYVAGGYNEAWPAQYKFNTSDPQSKTWVGRLRTTDQATDYVATDGNRVYWAGYDPRETSQTFVFATSVSNNALVNFGSNGTIAHMEWGGDYSGISYRYLNNSIISGLAVQQNGNYLFVSRVGQNELQVLDKNTGASVQRLFISEVAEIGIDRSGYLWAAHGDKLEKYYIYSDGTISSAGFAITGMSSIGGFGFSPDGTTIAVCDVANQVVKGFSTNSGSLLWTLGTPGGYLTDATVTDTKFYFKDVRGEILTYLVYLADGSFYVGDPGNCRTQHYSATRTFIDRIMYMPNTYKTSVDKSDPRKLYADFLQFEIDYSKPLASGWILKKNWAGNFGAKYNAFSKVFNPITFPNGRVYSMVQIDAVQNPVIELVEGGVIRYTGITLGQRTFFGTDGSKIQIAVGNTYQWRRYPLIGFDAANNPIWSAKPELLTDVPYLADDPVPANMMNEHPLTASNKIIFFNSNRVDGAHGNDYHLGGVAKGSTKWLWKTARGTENSYSGQFPEDGFFDNGNGVEVGNRAGGAALMLDDNIFWGYHGEFWKQSQTNKWNHVDANTGLFVGQFGVLTKDFPDEEAFAGGAGNVLEGSVVRVGEDVYLYHNDEGVNNGIHRWKISGLNTIEVQTATFVSQNSLLAAKGIELMAGLPGGGASLKNNQYGWTRTPAEDITSDISKNFWGIQTGLHSYDRFKAVDVHVRYRQEIGNMTVQRTLENNTALYDWTLKGRINFEGNEPNQAQGKAGSYLEVLDISGRIISRFFVRKDAVGGMDVVANDKVLAHFNIGQQQLTDKRALPISISAKSGVVTFQYADFPIQTTATLVDKNADWSKPATMRLFFFSSVGDNYLRVMDISEMAFYANTTLPVPLVETPSTCTGTGGIAWEYWNNVAGSRVSDIPLQNKAEGTQVLSSFATPASFGDKYGSRLRGFLCVPQTGNYTFYISCDDDGELWLSPNANPANKEKIAYVLGYTNVNEYTKYPSQTSRTIMLKAGESYYIEALHKEQLGGDHLSVAWKMPDGKTESPLPGLRLIPYTETPVANVGALVANTAAISCQGAGSIKWEYWNGITGTKVSSIPTNTKADGEKQITSFATPINTADNYGSRVRGYICVPQTGDYTFYIATDDEGELWLSTSANPADKKRIAFVAGFTSANDYNKYPSQTSVPITLKSGEKYYIEALQKEQGGGDNLSVAWKLPDGTTESPIPGIRLIPYEDAAEQPVAIPCQGIGNITWEYWINRTGSSVSNIPVLSAPDGEKQITSFATQLYFGENYGSRVRGYLCVPLSGDYTFYIATDDDGELWLSPSANPDEKKRIAYVSGWTEQNQFNKYPSQTSQTITLKAGEKYYIEALQKEQAGGDHLEVAWKLPDGKLESPIAGSRLIPYNQNAQSKPGNSQNFNAAPPIAKTLPVDLSVKTYPNPFKSTLNIECFIREADKYTVQIFDVEGKLIKTVFNGILSAGISRFTFDGSVLKSGMYICKFTSGKQVLNKQITLIR